jgi:GxxExxY protein
MDTPPPAAATPMGHEPDPLSFRVISATYRVHRELGPGFLESVYEAALEIELKTMGMTVLRQAPLDVHYRAQVIGSFRADLLVEDRLLVELKVATAIAPIHVAQVINYLRASRRRVGLLVNFGRRVQIRRLVL